MSQFIEDVSQWQRLICIEENSAALQRFGIVQIREDHVLDLTARYIRRLEGIQQRHDEISSTFASRVRPQLCRDVIDDETLELTCNRFLAGVDATLRCELPSSIQRSERLKMRRLVINWMSGGAEALWEGSGVSFPLRDLLLFCSEHSGGADDVTGEVIVDQLLRELHDGTATIPRFTWVSHDDRQSLLHWETAVVSVNDATAASPQTGVPIENAQEALVTCIEDCGVQFELDIHESLQENERDWEDLSVEATFIIDDADDPEEGGVQEQELEGLVTRANERGENEDRLIQAMATSAIKSVMAGIATKRPREVVNGRIAVVKNVKRIRKKRKKKQGKLEHV